MLLNIVIIIGGVCSIILFWVVFIKLLLSFERNRDARLYRYLYARFQKDVVKGAEQKKGSLLCLATAAYTLRLNKTQTGRLHTPTTGAITYGPKIGRVVFHQSVVRWKEAKDRPSFVIKPLDFFRGRCEQQEDIPGPVKKLIRAFKRQYKTMPRFIVEHSEIRFSFSTVYTQKERKKIADLMQLQRDIDDLMA